MNTVRGVTYPNKNHTNEDVDGRASPTIIINQLQGERFDPNHSISEKEAPKHTKYILTAMSPTCASRSDQSASLTSEQHVLS